MAGLGRKAFSAGEVLTAVNVQGYLMDQTVMVFTNATARDAALTSPSSGMFAYLTATTVLTYYNGSAWGEFSSGAGATGGGTDEVFVENDVAVTTNYSITSSKNAMTAGPIAVNAGVTITIPSGSVWTVV
jgi:hypothetical protein